MGASSLSLHVSGAGQFPKSCTIAVLPDGDEGIVLNVALGQPSIGLVPALALQQIPFDVICNLLVFVQPCVAVVEKSFNIGGREHRGLCGGTPPARQRAVAMQSV